MPPAPATFSTITCCPSTSLMRCATMRPMPSCGPPAANGITIVTERVGHSCAYAAPANAQRPTTTIRTPVFNIFSPPDRQLSRFPRTDGQAQLLGRSPFVEVSEPCKPNACEMVTLARGEIRGHAHGIFPAATQQRDRARLDLRSRRHRLHHGLRHHRDDQFRPWRRLHGGRLPRPDRLSRLARDRRYRYPAGTFPRVDHRDATHGALRLGGRAPRLSAVARLAQARAADLCHRHVDRAAKLRADRARSARQTAAATDPGRPHADRGRALRGAGLAPADLRRGDDARANAFVFLARL